MMSVSCRGISERGAPEAATYFPCQECSTRRYRVLGTSIAFYAIEISSFARANSASHSFDPRTSAAGCFRIDADRHQGARSVRKLILLLVLSTGFGLVET